jgi:hypothetical protein
MAAQTANNLPLSAFLEIRCSGGIFTLTEASNSNSQAFSLHQFHLILQLTLCHCKMRAVDKYTLPIGNISNQTVEFGTKRRMINMK